MKNATERLLSSIEELSRLYDYLNSEFFEGALSKPVITIMPEDRRRSDARVLGWFTTRKVWIEKGGERAYELNITADYADRSLQDIAETLLHEMAHQYAREHDIDDCSRAGTYHNKRYAQIASAHGLTVKKNDKYGYSQTELSPKATEVLKHFEFGESLIYRRQTLDKKELLDIIEKQISVDTPNREQVIEEMYRGLIDGKYKIGKDGISRKQYSTRKYICPCCKMSVRATRKVNIKCGDCNVTMKCENEDE